MVTFHLYKESYFKYTISGYQRQNEIFRSERSKKKSKIVTRNDSELECDQFSLGKLRECDLCQRDVTHENWK